MGEILRGAAEGRERVADPVSSTRVTSKEIAVTEDFKAFMTMVLKPGPILHKGRAVDVSRLDDVAPYVLTGVDNAENDYLSELELFRFKEDNIRDLISSFHSGARPQSRK
jgi:hypothetical protein